jgi:vacuolar-type H+-ATPase subunit E/Vma4
MSQVANTIISDAKEEAERILADARKEAEAEAGEILAEAREKSRLIVEATMRQQELAAAKIEESYSAMKTQHEECIDSIRSAWQEFLIGLDSEADGELSGEEVPSDLSEKVSALADALNDI